MPPFVQFHIQRFGGIFQFSDTDFQRVVFCQSQFQRVGFVAVAEEGHILSGG